ncbi:hypothetical protein OS493_030468 [Desmophyllum pertusum]|uniref:Uncharacterized protein n=1 Tax=Desmophyllum pertusum TaxID=174260 RepID=A0A9W9YXT9_9CNID|nr:hypothetical protein OS493_030468 [Desmophyllum pertusum]
MKESMLKGVRIEAGLGDSPSEYVNNDPEAANFMIKHGLHFDAKKPHHFIQEIKHIVEAQHRNEDRAVFGKGPFKVREEFGHLKVDDLTWGRLTHEQRTKKLSAFLMAGIDSKEDSIRKETAASLTETPSTSALSLTAAERHCLTKQQIFCLRLICEHTLAVAQLNGTLSEFIAWYRRSKRSRGTNMTSMTTAGGPKSAGRKPSQRKRSNTKAQPVLQRIDLLQHKSDELLTEDQSNSVPMNNQNHIPVPSVALQSHYTLNHHPLSQHFPMHNDAFLRQGEATANRVLTQQNGQPPPNQYGLQNALALHALPATNVNQFLLKWLVGTRVSRCYGCGGAIQNPPLNFQTILLWCTATSVNFRTRITGQLKTGTEPQNVHFHLRLACVRSRYPEFATSSLHVPPDFLSFFRVEHLNRLLLEFGWTPGN